MYPFSRSFTANIYKFYKVESLNLAEILPTYCKTYLLQKNTTFIRNKMYHASIHRFTYRYGSTFMFHTMLHCYTPRYYTA